MQNLTIQESHAYDHMSLVRGGNFNLGTRIQEIISYLPAVGTPRNARNSSVVLSVPGGGVVVDAAEFLITDAEGDVDTYLFSTDSEKIYSGGEIVVDLTAYAVKASTTLTLAVQPTSGDTFTIGSEVYTFVPVGTDTAENEISIGANLAEAKANALASINGTGQYSVAHPLVKASAFVGNVSTITARAGGVAGNAIVSTETFAAEGNVFAGAALASGADATIDNAFTALVAAITANENSVISALKTGANEITFSAKIAGISGDDIMIDSTPLASGVDGTVGVAGKVMLDASYIYLCISANLISGKNWRRISLGTVY
jgi:hypothetical protein